MKITTCSTCSGPVFALPGETPQLDCTSCREKPGTHCKAPGCGTKLRSVQQLIFGFCNDHHDTAYACQWKRCPERAAADSPGRLCIVHGVQAERRAETYGNPDGAKRRELR